jgi:hypothetical protein
MSKGQQVQPLKAVVDLDDRLPSLWGVDPPDDGFEPYAVLVAGPDLNLLSNRPSRFDGIEEGLFLNSSTPPGSDRSWLGRGSCKVKRIAANSS